MAQRITTEEERLTLHQRKSGLAIKRREMIHTQETPLPPIAMPLLSLTAGAHLQWFKVPALHIHSCTQTPITWHRAFLPPRRQPVTNLIREVTQVVGVGCKVHNNRPLKEIHSEGEGVTPALLPAAPVILHQGIAGEGAKRRLHWLHSRRILNFACSLT